MHQNRLSGMCFAAALLGLAAVAGAQAVPATPTSATQAAADPFAEKLAKSPRKSEWVDIKNGDKSIHTFVVHPAGEGKVPTIVLIHEIFGLSPWAKTMADEWAEAGYLVLAPDMLSGKGANGGGTESMSQADIRAGMQALNGNPEGVFADLNAVADHAKTMAHSNGKIVAAGFCWGGGYTFNWAAHRPDLAAGLVFYGPSAKAEDIAKIQSPIYGFYGLDDARIMGTVPDAQAAMKAANKTYEVNAFEGAGHGFMRSGDPNGPPPNKAGDKTAREKAFARSLEILKGLQ